MATKSGTFYCKTCQAKRLGHAPAPNHILHLLLTLVTFGFWAPVWLLITLFSGGRYHCSVCGNPM